MGMLQLAGAVSGFGKGLQQGLQNTQQYMSSSMLLKEREDMERERLKLTFAHDRGLLQERAKIESDAADKRYSRDLDLADQRQDFELMKDRIGREAGRQAAETEHARTLERDQKRGEQEMGKLIAEKGYQQQDKALTAKQEREKEERERKFQREKMQTEGGFRLQEQMLQNQRPYGNGGTGARLDPGVASRAKDLDLELDSLFDQKTSVMSDVIMKDDKKTEMLAAIERKIVEVRNKKNKLLGQPEEDGSMKTRPQYRFPE